MDRFTINPSAWVLGQPGWLLLLWALPLVILVWWINARLARGRMGRFIDRDLQGEIAGRRASIALMIRAVVTLVAIAAVVIGLARPQSDPREIDVETKGRDVVFLLDVSRSMLARDVAPNRLGRAKLWINDLVDELRGDRIGLVAFSGSSTVVSPLTTDKLFFKLALDELDTSAVPLGGTNIGDAIRRTMDMVLTDDSGSGGSHRDIVLITDGEDQESLPVQAAQVAGERGVRIIALGIGSRDGSIVPVDPNNPDGSNQPVRSSLQSASLTQIAAATPGGVYLDVGTGTIDLAGVYRDLIAAADQKTIGTSTSVQYQERYIILFAIALGAMLIEMLVLPTRERGRPCVIS